MKRGLWLAFAPQTDVKTARDRFLERYGHAPQAVHLVPGALLVGPIEKDGAQWPDTDSSNTQTPPR